MSGFAGNRRNAGCILAFFHFDTGKSETVACTRAPLGRVFPNSAGECQRFHFFQPSGKGTDAWAKRTTKQLSRFGADAAGTHPMDGAV